MEGWGEGLALSADLVGLLTPAPAPSSFRRRKLVGLSALGRGTEFPVPGREHRVPGIRNSGAGLSWSDFGLAPGQSLVLGVLWFSPFFCLGPLLQIQRSFSCFRWTICCANKALPQDVTVPLPFALLHYIPFLNANRVPNRFSVILVLSSGGAGRLWGVFSCCSGCLNRTSDVPAGPVVF